MKPATEHYLEALREALHFDFRRWQSSLGNRSVIAWRPGYLWLVGMRRNALSALRAAR